MRASSRSAQELRLRARNRSSYCAPLPFEDAARFVKKALRTGGSMAATILSAVLGYGIGAGFLLAVHLFIRSFERDGAQVKRP
jgi:hypothetical protein